MRAVDIGLFVGECPFRDLPTRPADLERLRAEAGLERAVATSFSALLYHDPQTGLERDLERYEALRDWLSFYAIINPEFPGVEESIEHAARDPRIAGVRLFPTLHHYPLSSGRLLLTIRLAAEHGLPVNLTARLLDGRVAPRWLDQGDMDLDALVELLRRAGDATLVLSMFFFDELRGLQVDWEALPGVYLDLGCCKPAVDSFDRLATWFPPQRVLFGSGAPLYYWKGGRLAVEGAALAAEQKEAILSRTAQGVFRWR